MLLPGGESPPSTGRGVLVINFFLFKRENNNHRYMAGPPYLPLLLDSIDMLVSLKQSEMCRAVAGDQNIIQGGKSLCP